MPKGPTLYRLAADRQYDAIPAHIQSNPDDLFWTDRYGSTALHILCQSRSADRRLLRAVNAILLNAPEQVAWANAGGYTPLHFAVEKRLVWGGDNCSTSLVLNLIRSCPSAVSVRTQTGFRTKTPFHISCESDADYHVLRAMLMINPALATEPFVNRDVYSVAENPLQLLWKHHQYNTRSTRSSNGSLSRRNLNHQQQQHQHYRSNRTKEKMALLLQAAHYGTVEQMRTKFRLLNAACSVRCPRDYFTQVLNESREQIDQPDEDGLHPLHYAVKNACADSQSYTQFVLESLLEHSVKAASVADQEGRLPLHVAVSDSLMTWHKGGIRELVFAYPNALRSVDPRNGLVPFLASAVSANKSRLHLSTTFELLLSAPEMVQPWKESNRLKKNLCSKNAAASMKHFHSSFESEDQDRLCESIYGVDLR